MLFLIAAAVGWIAHLQWGDAVAGEARRRVGAEDGDVRVLERAPHAVGIVLGVDVLGRDGRVAAVGRIDPTDEQAVPAGAGARGEVAVDGGPLLLAQARTGGRPVVGLEIVRDGDQLVDAAHEPALGLAQHARPEALPLGALPIDAVHGRHRRHIR